MTQVELERQKYAVVRAMFRKLATGEARPRAELFEGCPFRVEWQQKLLGRLVRVGVVEKVGEGKFTTWRLAQHDEAATHLQILSTDDDALAPLLNGLGARALAEDELEEQGEAGEGSGESWEGSGAPQNSVNGAGKPLDMLDELRDVFEAADEMVGAGDPRDADKERARIWDLFAKVQKRLGVGGEDDVRLDYALRLLAAMLENTIYIRDGVDELKGRVAALEEAFK